MSPLLRNEKTPSFPLIPTLNGSSLALPRVVAALLENNQKGDRIEIPEALRPYTGFEYLD